MADRETLLQRLVKLMNMADGAAKVGNQAEAEAFAAKAQELSIKYELDLSEAQRLHRNEAEPVGKTIVTAEQGGYKARSQSQQWQITIADAVAYAYQGYSSHFLHSNAYTFYGRPQNREMMVYVFVFLVRTAERLMKRARKEAKASGLLDGGSFQNSYLTGFALAIVRRLHQDRQKLAANANPHALVLVKNERDAVVEWVNANVTFSTKKSSINAGRGYSSSNARERGFADGTAVPLHKAAKPAPTPKLIT